MLHPLFFSDVSIYRKFTKLYFTATVVLLATIASTS